MVSCVFYPRHQGSSLGQPIPFVVLLPHVTGRIRNRRSIIQIMSGLPCSSIRPIYQLVINISKIT